MGKGIGEDAASTAMQRAGLYGLLATIFRGPMSSETLGALRAPTVLGAFRAADADPGADFTGAQADRLMHDLAVDYTQLFHGPRGHMPPYESVQRGGIDGGSLAGPAAARVRRFLAERGFALDDNGGELPDHVAVELEIMRDLIGQESSAWRQDDAAAALRCRVHQGAFLEQHLGVWAPDLGRRVQRQAETSFYWAAGKLLAEFLELELAESAARPGGDAGSHRAADTMEWTN